MFETMSSLLELVSMFWKCLDQSHSFTDASFPPEMRNLPLSPNSEKELHIRELSEID